MSQITRCPSCTTKFKVVADQLRISDGWVRCGHCKEIFDASAHLLVPTEARGLLPDVSFTETSAPATPSPQTTDVAGSWGSAPASSESTEPAGVAHVVPPSEAPAVDVPAPAIPAFLTAGTDFSSPIATEPDHKPATPATPSVPTDKLEGYELPFADLPDSDWPEDLEQQDTASPPSPDVKQTAPTDTDTETTDTPVNATAPSEAYPAQWAESEPPCQDVAPESALDGAPAFEHLPSQENTFPQDMEPAAEEAQHAEDVGFVRTARRKAFWRRPAIRAGLGLGIALLLCTLGLQVTVQERNRIAAMAPGMRPWLQRLCAPLHCAVAPLQQIADVVIDSSSFVKGRGDSYQLALAIKNRAPIALAMPVVELTLTDAQDQPVVRRVLLPQDLAAPPELPASGEWSASVAVIVTTGGARVAGYRLLAFYP